MAEKPAFHFFIPGLFQPLALWRKDFAFTPHAPSLLRLCAQPRITSVPVQGLEASLFHALGHDPQTDIPFAPYRYQLDFGLTPEQPVICADPVFLQSGVDQVVMRAGLPTLNPADMASVLALLNAHLQEDGLQLLATHPQHWYLQGEKLTESLASLRTVPLSQVQGQGIFPSLPTGEKRFWHRLLNEIQMLLHTSPQDRVNALWLWGASGVGTFRPDPVCDAVVGQGVAAEVAALAAGVVHSTAGCFADCQPASGNHWIVLDDLHVPSVTDDLHGWQTAMDKLERDWFAPALAAAGSGKCTVHLSACDGRILRCQPVPRWQFWRKSAADWSALPG